MTTNETPTAPPPSSPTDLEAQRRRDTRRALIFGVVMATIQMAVLLYFMKSC